jgi:hypothetical protein
VQLHEVAVRRSRGTDAVELVDRVDQRLPLSASAI